MENWGAHLREEFTDISYVDPRPEAEFVFVFDDVHIVVTAVTYSDDTDMAVVAEDSPLWDPSKPAPDFSKPVLVIHAMTDAELAQYGPDTSLTEIPLDEGRDLMREAMLMSWVASSLIGATDAITAVATRSISELADPAAYRELAMAAAPRFPLPLWMTIGYVVGDDGASPRPSELTIACTLGMEALGLYDLEIVEVGLVRDGLEAQLREAAFLVYDEWVEFDDGGTLTTSFGDVTVHFLQSEVSEQIVMRLQVPGDSGATTV